MSATELTGAAIVAQHLAAVASAAAAVEFVKGAA